MNFICFNCIKLLGLIFRLWLLSICLLPSNSNPKCAFNHTYYLLLETCFAGIDSFMDSRSCLWAVSVTSFRLTNLLQHACGSRLISLVWPSSSQERVFTRDASKPFKDAFSKGPLSFRRISSLFNQSLTAVRKVSNPPPFDLLFPLALSICVLNSCSNCSAKRLQVYCQLP